MNTLFDIGPVWPEGFSYEPDCISEDEERKLLGHIQSIELKHMQFHKYEAKRKVRSFGKSWSFTDQVLKDAEPIPQEFDFLIDRIATKLAISKSQIVQFLITEYPAGAVINWHRDAPPFAIIAGVSLISNCTFKLRPQEKEKQTRAATISLPVHRRSLYCMQGAAKTEWQHSTAPVRTVRYSLTFRTTR